MPRQPDYTIPELSKEMRVSRGVLYTLIGNGELNAYKVNGRYRITQSDVDTYKARNSTIKGYVYVPGAKVV